MDAWLIHIVGQAVGPLVALAAVELGLEALLRGARGGQSEGGDTGDIS